MEPAAPRPFPVEIPFVHELGLEFCGMQNGQARLELTLQARHMNSWQVTHGGVLMTLLDVVMSMAGRSLDPDARGGVTIEMKTSFLQPGGHAGARIVAKGTVLHRTTTMCFCEGEIWNGEKLAAKATGTFKYLKRLDVAKKLERE